ncbi:MAG TPA: helix-turn-helix domain-containing protein [Candidatus Coprosoma intestinipullorum]|uniref:Helix-turn-helix domain-containing protein n=1 Tax=Candidatus Coprosoma intestinipullorum TaxID=2840752 RepID=A0A9D0ZR11_9FIRM|nr:helix-turn-helix domain-containing protein [Candidatus Coprosoma intestinipullorum]
MDQEKIGRFIANCRKQRKMTQSELGEKLGVTEKSVSNWENGRNMPDLSLFKPLCNELNITLNDLLSGEKVTEKEYREKLEENIINTIDYTNKKLENRNNFIGFILITFGILISVSAIAIFPSESSWGSIYSVFGAIVSLIGVSRFTRRLTHPKRLLCNFSYFLIFIALLVMIDYIGVVNIHQAPRFSLVKVSGENIVYYDTPFYDVVRCNVDKDNETFKVIKNQKYDKENIDNYCK